MYICSYIRNQPFRSHLESCIIFYRISDVYNVPRITVAQLRSGIPVTIVVNLVDAVSLLVAASLGKPVLQVLFLIFDLL
jgi:hypothetical protein